MTSVERGVLRRQHRIELFWWSTCLLLVLVLLLISVTVFAPLIARAEPRTGYSLPVVLLASCVGLGGLIAAYVRRRRWRSVLSPTSEQTSSLESRFAHLSRSQCALSTSPALVGFAVYIRRVAPLGFLAVACGLSIMALVLAFPRWSQWTAWTDEIGA